jgi:hypothetical protein
MFRVTLCDFNIREVGHRNITHTYTVQCSLPINLFNQQIFLAVWIWYFVVLFFNIGEALVWINRFRPRVCVKWAKSLVLFDNIETKLIEKFDDFNKKQKIENQIEKTAVKLLAQKIGNIDNNTSPDLATEILESLLSSAEVSRVSLDEVIKFEKSRLEDPDEIKLQINDFLNNYLEADGNFINLYLN